MLIYIFYYFQIRRLYDVANVFKCLNIIKKTRIDNRKTGFEWAGIQGLI